MANLSKCETYEKQWWLNCWCHYVVFNCLPSRDSSYLLYVNLNSIYQIEIHEICFVKDSVKDLSV